MGPRNTTTPPFSNVEADESGGSAKLTEIPSHQHLHVPGMKILYQSLVVDSMVVSGRAVGNRPDYGGSKGKEFGGTGERPRGTSSWFIRPGAAENMGASAPDTKPHHHTNLYLEALKTLSLVMWKILKIGAKYWWSSSSSYGGDLKLRRRELASPSTSVFVEGCSILIRRGTSRWLGFRDCWSLTTWKKLIRKLDGIGLSCRTHHDWSVVFFNKKNNSIECILHFNLWYLTTLMW